MTHSTEKLRPDFGARDAPAAALRAARNEFEAFQIAITADGGGAAEVTALASPLIGPRTLPPPLLFREAVISLASPSAEDGAAGEWFDALVPDVDDVVGEERNAFPFDVPAGATRALWVEVFVPPDAPAGTYDGTVRLFSGAQALAEVPVRLTVWGFTLPSTSSLPSHFGLYCSDLTAQHGVTGDALHELRARYSQLGLDHRVSVSGFDECVTDLAQLVRDFGPLLDGAAPTRLQSARLTSVKFGGDSTTEEYARWAALFRARGWFDRLFDYTCDEPPAGCAWSDITARVGRMKAADPELRSLVTTDVQQATEGGVLGDVDVLAPVVNHLYGKSSAQEGGWDDAWSGPQVPAYDAFRSGGRKLWWYQSCESHGCDGSNAYATGWPSYMIDASAVRARGGEWLSFAWGVDGELYYQTTWMYPVGDPVGDPWRDQYDFTGNGDGTLFYPGTPSRIGGETQIPVASIRLKLIREGMEDYEYLKLLADAGEGALARETATSLFPDAWTQPSAEELLAARERVAARLLELASPPGPGEPLPVPGEPPPVPVPGDPLPGPDPSAPAPTARSAGCSASGVDAGWLAVACVVVRLGARRRRHSPGR